MNPKLDKASSNLDKQNMVQVFCRLRPLKNDYIIPSIKLISPTTLKVSSESKTKVLQKDYNYIFKHVFTSYSTQREVFNKVALPLLEDLVNGKNGLLFSYGITGSGKTHTFTGEPSNPGIIPTCINTLFNSVGDKQTQKYLVKLDRMNRFEIQSEKEALEEVLQEANIKSGRNVRKAASDRVVYINDGMTLNTFNKNALYSVFISYTEIYNNVVYDLLDESNAKFLQAKIVRVDAQKNMYVNGVVEIEVKSAKEAIDLFFIGQKHKRMAHTVLNAESSRSHSIFNIRIVALVKNLDGVEIPSQTNLQIGQLSLVDLAGSERCSRTNNTGIRLKEASRINNSLMTLRNCIEILRENQNLGTNKIVPYRDSRLTLLFKNYFEGDGETRMILCINPSEQDHEENLQI
ncbi:hypothetical protein FQA39_LY19007 [Lamprigera yunnana]|nr:hypothetical protein FQA39_LY19007 [Lamprigera yunnana]